MKLVNRFPRPILLGLLLLGLALLGWHLAAPVAPLPITTMERQDFSVAPPIWEVPDFSPPSRAILATLLTLPGHTPRPILPAPLVLWPDQYQAWTDDMVQGDVVSACHLARATLRCRELSKRRVGWLQRQVSLGERDPSSEEYASSLDALAREMNQYDADQAFCAGFPEAISSRAWEHLMRAAELGDPEAVRQWYISPPLDTARPLRDAEGWQAHRETVPALLEQSIAQGNEELLGMVIFEALGFHENAGRQGRERPQGFVLGLAAMYLVQRLSQDVHMGDNAQSWQALNLEAAATPAEQIQARAMAMRWYPAYQRRLLDYLSQPPSTTTSTTRWSCDDPTPLPRVPLTSPVEPVPIPPPAEL